VKYESNKSNVEIYGNEKLSENKFSCDKLDEEK
jgi:hypothetical protein